MPTSQSKPSHTVNIPMSKDSIDKRLCCCFFIFLFIILWVSFILLVTLSGPKIKLPRFQLDHVSVDHRNTTAVWDISFSIDRSVGDDFDVWVRSMGRDYNVESFGIAGNATVSVTTLLPRGGGFDLSGGLTLEKVIFRCNNYQSNVVEAACEQVAVGFSSIHSTQGVLKGGSRLCPIVSDE